MNEFTELEGPRTDESTVHVVLSDNLGLKGVLTSRVGARNMKKSGGYRTSISVDVVDGEAHIGDELWIICDAEYGHPSVAFHSKEDAEERASQDSDFKDEYLYGGEVKHWNMTTEKLLGASELRD